MIRTEKSTSPSPQEVAISAGIDSTVRFPERPQDIPVALEPMDLREGSVHELNANLRFSPWGIRVDRAFLDRLDFRTPEAARFHADLPARVANWNQLVAKHSLPVQGRELAILQLTTFAIMEMGPFQKGRDDGARNHLFAQSPDGIVGLSVLFDKGVAVCAECALAAHLLLNRQGIQNIIVSGERPSVPGERLAHLHSYLIIKLSSGWFLFEAGQTTIASPDENRWPLPDVRNISPRFMEMLASGQNYFEICPTIYPRGPEVEYGVNSGYLGVMARAAKSKNRES